MVQESLPLEIHDIHPSAVYQERVYTQDAVVSLDGQTKFEVYDPGMLLSADHIGSTQACKLLVFLSVIRDSDPGIAGINFDAEDQPVFRGQVTAVDKGKSGNYGMLDVDSGMVLFEPSDAEFPIQPGDWIQISRTVRHLRELH